MMSLIILVLIVLILVLFIQGRSSHAKIKEGLRLTQEIHTEVVIKRQEAGKVVDKHVALNKQASEELTKTVHKDEQK
jgi:low affinity Fe/Cu permease